MRNFACLQPHLPAIILWLLATLVQLLANELFHALGDDERVWLLPGLIVFLACLYFALFGQYPPSHPKRRHRAVERCVRRAPPR